MNKEVRTPTLKISRMVNAVTLALTPSLSSSSSSSIVLTSQFFGGGGNDQGHEEKGSFFEVVRTLTLAVS